MSCHFDQMARAAERMEAVQESPTYLIRPAQPKEANKEKEAADGITRKSLDVSRLGRDV